MFHGVGSPFAPLHKCNLRIRPPPHHAPLCRASSVSGGTRTTSVTSSHWRVPRAAPLRAGLPEGGTGAGVVQEAVLCVKGHFASDTVMTCASSGGLWGESRPWKAPGCWYNSELEREEAGTKVQAVTPAPEAVVTHPSMVRRPATAQSIVRHCFQALRAACRTGGHVSPRWVGTDFL